MSPTQACRVGWGHTRLDRLQGLGTKQKWPGSQEPAGRAQQGPLQEGWVWA